MRGGGSHVSLLFLILSVVRVCGVPVTSVNIDDVDHVEAVYEIHPDNVIQNENSPATLNGVVFKTSIRYFCSPAEFRQNSTTILYDTNGWTFPTQDINLTLSYPTSNQDVLRDVYSDFKITGYQVIMFTDGVESSGLITSGGLLETHITLNFNMSAITVLSYEFWLYGVRASQVGAWTYLDHKKMCS